MSITAMNVETIGRLIKSQIMHRPKGTPRGSLNDIMLQAKQNMFLYLYLKPKYGIKGESSEEHSCFKRSGAYGGHSE